MQKHRKKKTHYRKIAVAVGAVGILGVPTAAMACFDTQDTPRPRAAERYESRAWQHTAAEAAPAAPEAPAAPVVQDAPAPAAPVVQEPAPVREAPAPPPAAQPEPQAPAAPEPSAPTAAPDSGAAAQILALVNKERAAVGCPALTVNEQLTKAAQAHSEDMASHSTMSHTGSDGSDPGQRITRAGYEWRTYGENVAYGYSTAEQVMQGWMNSPGHRQNILNCAFKEIGVGLAQPNHYWTQDFGASR
ncbi:hypothetical protein SUDANB120_05805 [Streptomyces sp. enrichment culture]|uniref:CAP domain-containing protein n=1 Tax=Streptomyces sp. enrichment culture TaxID=1795815 RepID=UPI003F55AB62